MANREHQRNAEGLPNWVIGLNRSRGRAAAEHVPLDLSVASGEMRISATKLIVAKTSNRRCRAGNGEVKDLRREAQELKAVVAEQALELRLLKKA